MADLPDEICKFCYFYIGSGATAQGSITDFVQREQARFVDPDDLADVVVMRPPEVILQTDEGIFIGDSFVD